MISIFNGRKRTIGLGGDDDVYLQVSVALREHLHLFKGAKLAVFMAIALHSDKEGWSRPSVAVLCRETGFGRDTVIEALNALRQVVIDGHRVLLSYQSHDAGGEFSTNRYLVFPSDAEVAHYKSSEDSPSRDFTDTVKHRLGKTPTQRITRSKEEPLKACVEDSAPQNARAPVESQAQPEQTSDNDASLSHPAVCLFRELMGRTPNRTQRAEIAATVADRALFERVLRDLLLEGKEKSHLAVAWALERYRNNGQRPVAGVAAALPTKTAAERSDEARRKWEQKGGAYARASA